MEKANSVIQDLLTKTITPALSSWHCSKHDGELLNEVITIAGRRMTVRCVEQCPTEPMMQDSDRQETRMLLRRRMGVPERYLCASFSDFREDTGDQQQVAQQLREFVAGGWRKSPGLLFTGNIGTAKTLLGSALVNHWLDNYGNQSARFCTMLGLMRRIKATWNPESFETESILLQRLQDLSILVIDEVGVDFGSRAEGVLFTDIINERYNLLRPTILITNLTIQECHEKLGERVMDRLRHGGHALTFPWPSQRA